jgi:hypothetical protein
MFQVAFGDPDKSDSYGRKKKEEGRRKKEEGRKKKEEGRRKKEEAIDRIQKVQRQNILTLRAVAILIKSFAWKK